MTKLKSIAIIITSNSPELAQRSQDGLSDIMLRSGILNFPSDVTYDIENNLAGLDFSLPAQFDRAFMEEIVSEYLGMSLEFFHYDGEPVNYGLPPNDIEDYL